MKTAVRNIKLDVARTRFTENEVFGSGCGDCGWQSFERKTPRNCERCTSDNINPLEGCEIPYDDNHTRRESETFDTMQDAADWLRGEGATEFDGMTTFTDPDGSRIVDYALGEREELSVRVIDASEGPMEKVAGLIAESLTPRKLEIPRSWTNHGGTDYYTMV